MPKRRTRKVQIGELSVETTLRLSAARPQSEIILNADMNVIVPAPPQKKSKV